MTTPNRTDFVLTSVELERQRQDILIEAGAIQAEFLEDAPRAAFIDVMQVVLQRAVEIKDQEIEWSQAVLLILKRTSTHLNTCLPKSQYGRSVISG